MTNQNPFDITGLIELFTAGHTRIEDPVLDLPILESAMLCVEEKVLAVDPEAPERFIRQRLGINCTDTNLPSYVTALFRRIAGRGAVILGETYTLPGERTVGKQVDEWLDPDPEQTDKRIRSKKTYRDLVNDEVGDILRKPLSKWMSEEETKRYLTKALHGEAQGVRAAWAKDESNRVPLPDETNTHSGNAWGGSKAPKRDLSDADSDWTSRRDANRAASQQENTYKRLAYEMLGRKAQEPGAPYEVTKVVKKPFDHAEMQRQRREYWWRPVLGRKPTVAPFEDPDLWRVISHITNTPDPTEEEVRFKAAIARALLPRRQREILILQIEGHSNTDIAAELNIAESTIRTHEQEIRKRDPGFYLPTRLPAPDTPLKEWLKGRRGAYSFSEYLRLRLGIRAKPVSLSVPVESKEYPHQTAKVDDARRVIVSPLKRFRRNTYKVFVPAYERWPKEKAWEPRKSRLKTRQKGGKNPYRGEGRVVSPYERWPSEKLREEQARKLDRHVSKIRIEVREGNTHE